MLAGCTCLVSVVKMQDGRSTQNTIESHQLVHARCILSYFDEAGIEQIFIGRKFCKFS